MSVEIPATIVGENLPPSGVSESPISLNHSDLRAKASEYLDKFSTDEPVEKAEPVVAATVKPAAAKQPESIVEDQPVPVQTKSATKLADDDLVEVLVDGEIEVRPWKDVRSSASGEFKFTKSMQQLAAERKALDAAKAETDGLRTQRDNFRAFLSDEAAIREFVQRQYPNLLTPAQAAAAVNADPNVDPNEIATLGQVNETVSKQVSEFKSMVEQVKENLTAAIEKKTRDIKFAEEVSQHQTKIANTLTEVFTANPVLKTIPNAEDVIRFEVSKMTTPQTTEPEALEMFRRVSQDIVENLGKHFNANKKIQAVAAAKQKLETSSIEPNTGSNVQIAPTTYRNKDGQVDMKKVRDQAKAFLAGM